MSLSVDTAYMTVRNVAYSLDHIRSPHNKLASSRLRKRKRQAVYSDLTCIEYPFAAIYSSPLMFSSVRSTRRDHPIMRVTERRCWQLMRSKEAYQRSWLSPSPLGNVRRVLGHSRRHVGSQLPPLSTASPSRHRDSPQGGRCSWCQGSINIISMLPVHILIIESLRTGKKSSPWARIQAKVS